LKLCDLTQFYSPVSGGVKRYIHEKTAYLRAHTSDEHVLIIPGERTGRSVDGPSRVYTIRSPLVSRTSRYRMLLDLEAVEEILVRERPDLIESGDPYQVAWKAIFSGRALRIPVIGFYHSHFPEAYLRSAARFFGPLGVAMVMDFAERYVRALYSRFARTLVPSAALAEVLRGWGVENTTPTDLGVDIATFHPRRADGPSTRARLGIPPDRTLLLYVGRLAPEKNTRTLFAAFRQLQAAHPGRFHLLAVGDGTQRSLLEELRETAGGVTWLPYCADSADLAELYRSADLFVHPGVQETFGLVTLEAQACGTPVVGIRGSYMDRIILSAQDHWARENTPAALAGAIGAIAADPAALRAAGAAAAERVAATFSWEEVFGRLFAVYREVASAYRGSIP
jgi:alpha-1,6-mannosyltransferase